MKKNSTCPKCGHKFSMGYDGTVGGCDQCTGVERDANGYFWNKDEQTQERYNIATGETYTVRREDAFKKAV